MPIYKKAMPDSNRFLADTRVVGIQTQITALSERWLCVVVFGADEKNRTSIWRLSVACSTVELNRQ